MPYNGATLYPLFFARIQILTKLEGSAADAASSAKLSMLPSIGSNLALLRLLPLLKCLSPSTFYYAYLRTSSLIVRQRFQRRPEWSRDSAIRITETH